MNGTAKNVNVSDFGPHVPEDKVQYRVRTPYGNGLTVRTRKATKDAPQMRQIELLDWKHSTAASSSTRPTEESSGVVKPAYLYSTVDFPSVTPQVGDDVVCVYGRGKVTEVREPLDSATKPTLVVLLSSWRLATRSRVTCYLEANDAVRVVRRKKLYEMTVHERVEAALEFKRQAAQEFTAKDYRGALQSYAKAVDAVRYVQHKSDSDNHVRADLLVVMVTCSNNAGMCARHLGHWDESFKFGKNAEVLLDAVEKKKGLKIHSILVKEGTHDVKLFGEWKVKSLMLQARALAEKKEFDQTMDILKTAHEIIAKYATPENAEKYAPSVKTLRILEKEVKKLHAGCKERKSLVLKKEKQRAAAMFGGSQKNANSARSNTDSNPAEAALSNGVAKDKENQVPNGSSKPSHNVAANNSFPKVGTILPLNDSSESSLEEKSVENGHARQPKRRVSFSEKVTSYEIPNDDENKRDIGAEKEGDDVEDLVEVAWYNDKEVLLGAAIFGGAVVVSSLMVSALLRRRS